MPTTTPDLPLQALVAPEPPAGPIDPQMIEALRRQHVHVVYQPQYTLATMQLCGFEALARLHLGGEHWAAPERFLPLAHAAGLIAAVTLHMVESACRALQRWRNGGRGPVFIAVNVEPEDLCDILFAPRISRLLAQYHVQPGELELELVERRAVHLGTAMQANIALLRAAGVRLTMDDFGTGASTLAQLCELPFDVVKIDKSFLVGLPADSARGVLLDHVIGMCRALHKQVVVEGVETETQRAWLAGRHRQGLRVQGNGLCFPLPEALAAQRIALLPGGPQTA